MSVASRWRRHEQRQQDRRIDYAVHRQFFARSAPAVAGVAEHFDRQVTIVVAVAPLVEADGDANRISACRFWVVEGLIRQHVNRRVPELAAGNC